MLFGNGKAQQDTNGAEAEFKTGNFFYPSDLKNLRDRLAAKLTGFSKT